MEADRERRRTVLGWHASSALGTRQYLQCAVLGGLFYVAARMVGELLPVLALAAIVSMPMRSMRLQLDEDGLVMSAGQAARFLLNFVFGLLGPLVVALVALAGTWLPASFYPWLRSAVALPSNGPVTRLFIAPMWGLNLVVLAVMYRDQPFEGLVFVAALVAVAAMLVVALVVLAAVLPRVGRRLRPVVGALAVIPGRLSFLSPTALVGEETPGPLSMQRELRAILYNLLGPLGRVINAPDLAYPSGSALKLVILGNLLYATHVALFYLLANVTQRKWRPKTLWEVDLRGILGWSIPIHHYTRDHLSSPITVTAAVLGLQVLVHAAAFWMRNRRQGRDAPNPDAARAASLASSRSLKRQSWTTHRVQVEQAHRFASTATRVGESLISARDDSFTHSTSSPSSASGASAAAPANQPILERLASAPVRMSTGLLVERPVVSGPVPADPTRTTVDNDSTSSHEWMVWRNTLVTMAAWFTILCLLVVFCAFFVPGEIARVKDDPVIGHGVRLGRQFVPPQTQEILANLFKQVGTALSGSDERIKNITTNFADYFWGVPLGTQLHDAFSFGTQVLDSLDPELLVFMKDWLQSLSKRAFDLLMALTGTAYVFGTCVGYMIMADTPIVEWLCELIAVSRPQTIKLRLARDIQALLERTIATWWWTFLMALMTLHLAETSIPTVFALAIASLACIPRAPYPLVTIVATLHNIYANGGRWDAGVLLCFVHIYAYYVSSSHINSALRPRADEDGDMSESWKGWLIVMSVLYWPAEWSFGVLLGPVVALAVVTFLENMHEVAEETGALQEENLANTDIEYHSAQPR